MTDHPPPPNPSRRKLLTWFTDRNAAGEIGAAAGKIVREAQEIAQELHALAQETADAVTEPERMAAESVPDTPPDAVPAANADLHAEVQRLDEAVAALQTDAAASRQTDAAVLQHQVEIASQLQALQRMIDERLPQAQTEVERSHLVWLHNQTKHLITLFLGATGAALYEALVSDAVYEPIKAWWEQQRELDSVQAQPASPAPTPEATPGGESVRTLRMIMQDRHRPAKERLDAGLRLSDLGVLPEGLDDFIAVPGTDFRIGKYPVTNCQFQRFVDAGGYAVKDGEKLPWWSAKGWKWRQDMHWVGPTWWQDVKFGQATQPVVGITWYEAEAYCAWLNNSASYTHLPGGANYLPAGYQAQLPTREQWNLAARNGQDSAPTDDVDYPWGGVFNAAYANTSECLLHQTTPVDMYWGGKTQAGIFDLTGNVWEWTTEWNPKYSELMGGLFLLKGGAFYCTAEQVQISAARWSPPTIGALLDRTNIKGFRVVVIPYPTPNVSVFGIV